MYPVRATANGRPDGSTAPRGDRPSRDRAVVREHGRPDGYSDLRYDAGPHKAPRDAGRAVVRGAGRGQWTGTESEPAARRRQLVPAIFKRRRLELL